MIAFAIKTPPQHGPWSDFLDVRRAADDIDVFESAWTMDHFYPLTPPLDGPHLESWAVLAALAQATKRLRLGCMVNGMHYRHPAVTANATVTPWTTFPVAGSTSASAPAGSSRNPTPTASHSAR